MKFYNVFSGNLSGKFREFYVKNQGDKVFNCLHSYWYFKGLPDEKILEAFEVTKGNIMIDSGAFTAWTKDIEIDVDEYIKFINKWDKYVTLFGQIDVIPAKGSTTAERNECCKKTWENFLYMYERLNNPQKLLYTYHCGEPIEWLQQALEWRDSQGRKLDYIAIGGLVGRSTTLRDEFLTQAFTTIKASSNPNVKVHGFGVTSMKIWKKFPFESCDSFTPGMNANHGFGYNEKGAYRAPDYDKIFKPRGKTEEEQAELDRIEKEKDAITLEAESDARTDEKTKLLVANIEYWTKKAEKVKKPEWKRTDNLISLGNKKLKEKGEN